MKKIILLLLIGFFSIVLYGQTGPGGVGNNDGSDGQPENVLWFVADSLSLSDTDPVTAWPDESGNGNDAIQAVSASQPLYRTGQINGLPAVVFDGTNDYMPFDGSLIVNSDYTVIFVGARQTSSAMKVFLGGTTSSANQNLHLYWENSNQFRAHHYGNDLQTDMVDAVEVYSDGTETGEYGIFTTLLASTDASNNRRNYQNNSYLGARSNSTKLSSYNGAALGRYNSGYHDVNAAEVIVYSNALNDAQLQIVYQYLNEKYNIAIFNDLFDPIAAYNYGIVGIGEESNGEQSETNTAGLYLTATSGLNVSDYIFVSHNNLANNSSNFRTGSEVTNAGADSAYNRLWYMKPVGTPEAQLAFDFDEALSDGLNPTNISNYVLLYRVGTSGDFTIVKNADGVKNGDQVYFNLTSAEINEGYYTLGTEDAENSPLEGVAGRTWYTLISGNWGDWEIWTLDPSGALPNNPDSLTPNNSPTAAADKVVILTGRTVDVDTINNLTHDVITVEGRLDLTTSTSHSFGEIKGTGRILMAADNFPSGDASHFSSEGQGEGTVEYYGGSYELTTAREFFDVEIELADPANVITLLNDYTINGNLTLTTGELQINDATDDQIINLTVNSDVLVDTNGEISVGTGNPFATEAYQIGSGNMPEDDGLDYHDIYHQFIIYGDFTNRGTVRFTNLDAPDYNSLATDGAVTVRFEGATNNAVNLYNSTDFYNLVIDKGTDKTYKINLYSDNSSYFRLFGANSVGRTTGAPYSAEDPQIRKALFIYHGTLQLRGNIDIPTLSEGDMISGNGDYAVGKSARFWIDGNNVTLYSTASNVDEINGFTSSDTYTADGVTTGGSHQALSLYGEFRITKGFFGTRNSAGFIFWSTANGQVKIEGGTVNVSQMRSAGGGSGVASYIQSGGTTIVRGNETEDGQVSNSYPVFGFDDPSGVFNMSGGEIIFYDRGGSTTNGMYVPSAEGNYNVTGGKVTVEVASGNDFEIGMNAPVWDFEIKRLSGTGTTVVRLTNELTVLGDLTINDNCRLDVQDDEDATNYDLYIRDDFFLHADGEYNARDNTTHFIGDANSTIRVYDNTADELTFYNLHISKKQTWSGTTYRQVAINGTNTIGVNPVDISNNLTITLGNFYTEDEEVHVKGNIEIKDGLITNGNGKIVLNGTAEQTIKGPVNKQLDFGRYELDNEFGAKLLGNINVTDFELTPNNGNSVMNIDIYNLNVIGDLTTSGTFSEDVMFKTAGNVGDGGITRIWDLSLGVSGTSILFPIGSGTMYTPATLTQNGTINDEGLFTINPVDDYHPAIKPGEEGKTIPYYWVVDTADFSILSYDQIQYQFEYPGTIPGGVKKGANLWDGDWTWYDMGNVQVGSTLTFPYNTYLTMDFALGNPSIFKTPEVYYTRDNAEQADWKTNATWVAGSDLIDANGDGDINSEDWHDSRQPAAGSYPQAGDIAVIGWVPWDDPKTSLRGQPHSARWNGGDLECAIIQFTQMLDASGNPTARVYRNEFQFRPTFTINSPGSMNIGKIQGEGLIRVRDASNIDPDFSTIDISGFTSQDSSYFLYEAFSNKVYNNAPDIYPNLFISNDGWGANDRDVTINKDIIVYGNFEVRGNANYILPIGATGDVEIFGNLIVDQYPVGTGGAEFAFGNTGTSRDIVVHGDLMLAGDGAKMWIRNPENTDIVDHNLYLYGNINQNTTGTNDIIRFWTADDEDRVTLNILGNESAEYTRTSGDVSDFYRIIMTKEAASDWVAFNFMDAFTLNGPTDTDDKAIELISGRLGLRDSGIDVTLSSGGADFKIPSEAKLWLGSSSTVRISGDNTGIWLDGQLDVGFGVNALFDEGNNNYIEYTSSGNSEIYINGGNSTFRVGSQIRRSTSTEEGILNFRLTSTTADVVIGTDAGNIPENDRGILEILNAGSNLEMSNNTKIIIANAQDNPAFSSVYIDPESYSLGSGSEIQFGGSQTETDQIIGLFSNIELENLSTNNDSGNDPTLKFWTNDLTVNDDVFLDAGTSINTDGWNLTLKGDFINNGTYIPSGNTTFFSGITDQSITGATTFYNLFKTTSNQLTINNDVDVDNELNFSAGSFNDNDNTLSVRGRINLDVNHTWGGSSNGILLNGSIEQVLTGNGTIGKLSVNNSSGISIPQGNVFTITGELQLERGVLDIGKNLLVLNENAIIREQNPFSETNMIQTNISFTDAGVKKLLPAIVPSDNYSFIYPIGSEGKYTPVEFDIDDVNTGGSIRVKAANEMHPTITDDAEPCNEIDDVINVLKYHWVLEADNISGLNANATMQYYSDDYQENSAFYDVTDYIAARLLFGSTLWNKYDQASFDELNNQLKFSFTNIDDNGISGDYTAGVEDQGGTCEGAIPDEVPAYISIANGNWTDETIWDTYPTLGGTVPSGGPRGAIAIVEHEVTIPSNYILNYKTTINATGTVKVGSTFGHRLGIVDGQGTLQLERGNLPAGVYDDFFGRAGGTIEFTGSDNYDVLSEVNNVRNIIFSGTGERRLPNLDFEVYGEFAIDGSDGNLWVINEHDRNMTLDSNVVFNQGKFDAGVDPSTVTFGGTYEQIISGTGSFTSSNAFRNVVMNNSNGVTLSSPVEIKGTLAFTSGIITTDATNILTINNTDENAVSGSSTSNYVDGPMQKLVQTGGNFEFPVGDAGRYGPVAIYNTTNGSADYWIAEYFNAAYSNTTVTGSLVDVSADEYWEITNPSAGDAAEVELRWDSNSGITPITTGDINDIVVAEFNGTNWEDKASNAPSGGDYAGTVKTTSAINTDPIYYTLGSTASLLAQAYFTNPDDVCEGVDIPVSFSGVTSGELNFTLYYSYNSGAPSSVNVTSLPYSLPTTDGAGTYELTGFEYNNGGNSGTVDNTVVTVIAAPAQPTITPDDGDPSLTFCEGGSVILTSSAGTGYLWSTGATTQNINVTTSGNYTVQVSNATGCYSVASDPKTVTVNPLPVFTPSAVPGSICFGETSQLNANFNDGSTTYIWSPDADLIGGGSIQNPVFDPSITGSNPTSPTQVTTTFTVTVTDANSCSDSGTVDVIVTRRPETGPQYHISNDWGN